MSNRFLLWVGAFVALAASVVLPAPVSAQNATGAPTISMELNRLEEDGGKCLAYVIFRNDSPLDMTAFSLELLVFDRRAIIQKRLKLDAAPIFAEKTTVKLFELGGVPCSEVGQILLNDFYDCGSQRERYQRCIKAVTVSSRIEKVEFVK